MAPEKRFITVSEIVRDFKVSRKTIQRWIKAGKLNPDQTLPGRTGAHLFTLEEAERAFGSRLQKEVPEKETSNS